MTWLFPSPSLSLIFYVRATMNKRLARILLVVAVGLVVAWFAIPRPIEGYWLCHDLFAVLDGEHQFLRFSDGRVFFYDPSTPPHYHGTYRKIGWNTYRVGEDLVSRFPGSVPDVVKVSWFRCTLPYAAPGRPSGPVKLYRDWRIWDVSRVMRLSQANASTNALTTR